METKFLSDGRKVVIVGALNNQETIVQEVFVTQQGDEIPGGERFIAKSLHDTPVETYLSKEKARQELALEKAKSNIESINREITDTRNKLKLYSDQLKQVKDFTDNIKEQDLSHFIDVMTGQLNYAVRSDYRIPKIEHFSDFMSCIDNYYGNKKYEGMKAMTVLGNSDGRIGLLVNRYSDGSGCYSDVTFFKTYEEAREFVKSCAMKLASSLSVDELKELKRIGVVFDDNEMQLIRAGMHSILDKRLERITADFYKAKEKIDADKEFIEQQIKEL
ncbi:hypothetical protein ACUNG1_14090 [Serratia sp. IR-2025]